MRLVAGEGWAVIGPCSVGSSLGIPDVRRRRGSSCVHVERSGSGALSRGTVPSFAMTANVLDRVGEARVYAALRAFWPPLAWADGAAGPAGAPPPPAEAPGP